MGKTFNLGDPAPVGRRVLVKNWKESNLSEKSEKSADRIFLVYGEYNQPGNPCHGWFKIGNPGKWWGGMLVYPPRCDLIEEDQTCFADPVGYPSPTKYAVLHPGRIRNES